MPETVYSGYTLTTVFEVKDEDGLAKYNFLNLRKGECVGFAFTRQGVVALVCKLENGNWGITARKI